MQIFPQIGFICIEVTPLNHMKIAYGGVQRTHKWQGLSLAVIFQTINLLRLSHTRLSLSLSRHALTFIKNFNCHLLPHVACLNFPTLDRKGNTIEHS